MRYLKTISSKKISTIALSAIMVFANPTGGSAQDWPDPLVELVSINADSSSYFNDGKIGLVFVTFIGQTAILILTGMIFFGIELPTEPAAWWRFTWISILGLTSCTLLGIAFSSVPKSGKGASAVVTPIVLVLQFTSGVFFFFGDLPSWMQNFAAVFPLKWLTQGMRSVFLPPEAAVLEIAGSFEIARTAQVLLIWLVIAAVLAAAGLGGIAVVRISHSVIAAIQ